MPPEDEIELKPCPFCGCETIREFHPFGRRGYVIDCNRCNGGFHEMNEALARERWNTRAEASGIASLRQALELHVAYEETPADRGGKDGPKGRAYAAFIAARDAALKQ